MFPAFTVALATARTSRTASEQQRVNLDRREFSVKQSSWQTVIDAAMTPALEYLRSLSDRDVYRPTNPDEIRERIAGPLPSDGRKPADVVAELARDIEPFLSAGASGRYYGFVIGGLHPAAYGADLLCSTWDQNAGLYAISQGTTVVEEVAAQWLIELLRLPSESSVGFVTGGQMANFTCLAAARNHVLTEANWNVETQGLQGAPRINVVVKADQHSSIARALRYLGLGEETAHIIPCDQHSRMDVDALREHLETLEGPTIVMLEAGNVDTGSFDPFDAVADVVTAHRNRGNPSWIHVDGAIGLWAAASDSYDDLTDGISRCDSWSTDGHKLLNVGYDSGIAMCRHAASHRAAMSKQASYLVHGEDDTRDALDWSPEFSRRARGVPIYATLRSLGRTGVVEMMDQMCAMARRFADKFGALDSATIVNEVVFNQVLVRWRAPDDVDVGAFTDRLLAAIQEDGTAYFSGTTRRGQRLMRIAVSDWATDEEDVDRVVDAVHRCFRDLTDEPMPTDEPDRTLEQ